MSSHDDVPAPEAFLLPAVAAGETGVPPDPSVTALFASHAEVVDSLPGVLLYDQLTQALVGKHPDAALQWLRDAGLLIRLLPDLDATVAFSQEGDRRHKDVWEHTKMVVRQSVPRPAVRWGAVLHDIGKVPTRRFLSDGKVTFHGHAEVGVRMFRRGAARKIAFPDEVRARVEELIRYHLRPGHYDGSWSDAAVRRFTRDLDPLLGDLFALSRADVTSARPGKRRRCLSMIATLAERIERLRIEDAKPKVLPPGLGNLLMSELGLPPGKHLAELRGKLESLAEAGALEMGQTASYYLDAIRERDLLEGISIREVGARRRGTDRPTSPP